MSVFCNRRGYGNITPPNYNKPARKAAQRLFNIKDGRESLTAFAHFEVCRESPP